MGFSRMLSNKAANRVSSTLFSAGKNFDKLKQDLLDKAILKNAKLGQPYYSEAVKDWRYEGLAKFSPTDLFHQFTDMGSKSTFYMPK